MRRSDAGTNIHGILIPHKHYIEKITYLADRRYIAHFFIEICNYSVICFWRDFRSILKENI